MSTRSPNAAPASTMSLHMFFEKIGPYLDGSAGLETLVDPAGLTEHERFMYAYYPRAADYNPRDLLRNAFTATRQLSARLLPNTPEVFETWCTEHLAAHRPPQLARVPDGFAEQIGARAERGEVPSALAEMADYEGTWFALRTASAPAPVRAPKQKYALSPMCEVRKYTVDVVGLFQKARDEGAEFPDEAPAKEGIYVLFRHRDNDRPRRMQASMPQLLYLGLLTGEASPEALREAGMTPSHIVAAERALYERGLLWDVP